MAVRKREWTAADGTKRSAWQADYVDQNGKRQRPTFKTKREAAAFLAKATVEVQERRHVPASEAVTVRAAVDGYLKACAARVAAGELERRSLADIKAKLAHVLGERGIPEVKVPHLSFSVVDAMRLRLIEHGMSQANARKVVAQLRAFVNWAVDDGLATRNELMGRKSQRRAREKVEVDIPAAADVKALLVASDDLPAPYGLYVRAAALTGARAGELRGLQWKHVDFDGATIKVEQRAEQSGEIGLPKTAAGHRTIPVPPDLLRRLREAAMAVGRDPDRHVFAPAPPAKLIGEARRQWLADNGGPVDHDNFGSRHWRPLLKRLGLSMKFHGLRHYYASALIAAGVPITEVSRRLGHADVAMTLRVYSHALPESRSGGELSAIEAAIG